MIKWLEEKRIFAITLTLLMAIEIFYFSSIQGSGIKGGPSIPFASYAYHFTAFFLLSFFLLVSLNGNKKINFNLFVFAIIFSVVYAVLDEVHQMFVPFRAPSIVDVFTDNAGIFFSSLVYLFYKKN